MSDESTVQKPRRNYPTRDQMRHNKFDRVLVFDGRMRMMGALPPHMLETLVKVQNEEALAMYREAMRHPPPNVVNIRERKTA